MIKKPYERALEAIEYALKTKDVEEKGQKIISAYTLYKALDDTFATFYEAFHDPEAKRRIWEDWNSEIKPLNQHIMHCNLHYEEARCEIQPCFHNISNSIRFNMLYVKDFYSGRFTLNKYKGDNAIFSDMRDFVGYSYDPKFPETKEQYYDVKLPRVNQFLIKYEEYFRELFRIMEAYSIYRDYIEKQSGSLHIAEAVFKSGAVSTYITLSENGALNNQLNIYDPASEYKQDFSYELIHSDWSDGRSPIYQLLNDNQEALLKKIPVQVAKLNPIFRQILFDSLDKMPPTNNLCPKVRIK